jgi:hypothetical protein
MIDTKVTTFARIYTKGNKHFYGLVEESTDSGIKLRGDKYLYTSDTAKPGSWELDTNKRPVFIPITNIDYVVVF